MTSSFHVEFSPKAVKDIDRLHDKNEAMALLKKIDEELSSTPWPFGTKKKKIRGISYALYRLRLETPRDSYRIFYIVADARVTVLRIVKKKDADKIIASLK